LAEVEVRKGKDIRKGKEVMNTTNISIAMVIRIKLKGEEK